MLLQSSAGGINIPNPSSPSASLRLSFSLKLQQVESKSRPPATAPVHHKSQRQRQISWEDPAQQRRVARTPSSQKRAPSNVTPGSPPSSSTPPFLLYR
ncbi:hypothetical protein ACFXTO_015003 [Malus domestica]